jgi:subtilase family serine protease
MAVIVASAGMATIFGVVPAALASGGTATAATPATVTVQGSQSAAATPSADRGAVPASSTIAFDVTLNPRDAAGIAALDQAVSDPTSPSYKHYVTAAQWESEFSPTSGQVAQVKSWLRGQGLSVGAVTPDRLSIAVSGTASQVSKAFGTSLNNYSVRGKTVRMTSSAISVPSGISALVQGAPGLDQVLATPTNTNGSDQSANSAPGAGNGPVPSSTPIPPPSGFRNATPCGTSYGQLRDKTDPAYGSPYGTNLPYSICGYTPQQLESAYGLSSDIASGIDGAGQTVAIIDAYQSDTLLADAQQYYTNEDPAQPLLSSQFSTDTSPVFDDEALCGASGWSGEQTLDVEAVHAMAPGANILFVGAEDCVNGLLASERQVVDNHLADIITNSWGDDSGDLLDSASDRAANDTVFELAIATGISIMFSAGDGGDEFTTTGLTTADYPPSSPYVTAVGGTSLEVNAAGARTGEVGWSTSKSYLCTASIVGLIDGCTTDTLGTYIPPAPGAYDYGGGGGTSYNYEQPYYQAGIVPTALADRNSAVTGTTPARVEPDFSMDADPTTGFLTGETQQFPGGAKYGQYRIGGTSLASPLLAGVIAQANQVSGSDLGFVNPALYSLYTSDPSAIFDVVPTSAAQADVREDYVNEISAADGIITSVRTLAYEGIEEFCDGTGSCETRDVALSTTPGFDSMTGLGTPNPGFVQALASK